MKVIVKLAALFKPEWKNIKVWTRIWTAGYTILYSKTVVNDTLFLHVHKLKAPANVKTEW
jgi:hypothetical protein